MSSSALSCRGSWRLPHESDGCQNANKGYPYSSFEVLSSSGDGALSKLFSSDNRRLDARRSRDVCGASVSRPDEGLRAPGEQCSQRLRLWISGRSSESGPGHARSIHQFSKSWKGLLLFILSELAFHVLYAQQHLSLFQLKLLRLYISRASNNSANSQVNGNVPTNHNSASSANHNSAVSSLSQSQQISAAAATKS